MTESSISLFFESMHSFSHDHMSQKAAVLDILHYLQDHNIHISKKDVFHYFNVAKQTRFHWVKKNESQRLHNHSDSDSDSCDHKEKLTHKDMQKMKNILMNKFYWRVLNWWQLAIAAEISEVCDHTICYWMQNLDYHFCIVCSKSWISSYMKK